MWAKIITIKITKDLNYFSLCALNFFNTRVSQFELNYWNKWTFPRHTNLLRCSCSSFITLALSKYPHLQAASENLGSWLAASLPYEAMTLQAAFFARRHLMKLISDRFLRQRSVLMIYNKIERVLVITKQIFNYYNTNFSLEITSKVQKVNLKYTFTQKN